MPFILFVFYCFLKKKTTDFCFHSKCFLPDSYVNIEHTFKQRSLLLVMCYIIYFDSSNIVIF